MTPLILESPKEAEGATSFDQLPSTTTNRRGDHPLFYILSQHRLSVLSSTSVQGIG